MAGWGQGACVAPPPGISAWFSFDEREFQRSGRNAPRVVPGMVGNALRFNGKDQYYEVPAATKGVAVGEANFTIEFWVRTGNGQTLRNIIDKRSMTPFGYALYTYHGRPGVQIANGNHGNVTAARSIADNRWHHLAAVAQRLPPDFVRLYVDGVEAMVGSHRAALNNLDVQEPLWLGRHHPNHRVNEDTYFDGELDELTFYRRGLKAAEVKAVFLAGRRGKCKR